MKTGAVDPVRRVLRPMLWVVIPLALLGLIADGRPQSAVRNERQAALEVTFRLASNFASGDEEQRKDVLDLVTGRSDASDQEQTLTQGAFKPTPVIGYRTLAAADSASAGAYLRAMGRSYARYSGALEAGDRDWASKQLKAAQEYAELSANALLSESEQDERDALHIQTIPFCVRRNLPDELAFLEKVKQSGFAPDLRTLMERSGQTDAEISTFRQKIIQIPADQVGSSPVEKLSQVAALRRALAAELSAFANADPGSITGASAQTLIVGNPHDRGETIDLFIRPISIPPDWKLSIVNAEEGQTGEQTPKAGNAPPKYPVHEIDPGKHYSVNLPAKAETKVASVIIPVGEVGARTTARWAVEGKIGDDLIGGMVHEMNVPYIIADLKLPPVGSKEVEEEVPAPSRMRLYLAVAVAGILIVGAFLFFLFWRRRRGQTAT